MSASQTRRSAGVLARLAARLFEKNRARVVAGRSFVPAHLSVAELQPSQLPSPSALILRPLIWVDGVPVEDPQAHNGDSSPTTSKDGPDRPPAPERFARHSRRPAIALPPRA